MKKYNACYFIYGEERYLIEQHLLTLCQKHASLNKEVFSDKFDLSSLIDASTTVSLFSSSKLILLKNPFFLYSDMSADDMTRLQTALETAENNQNIVIIYSLGKKVDLRRKCASYLKKTLLCYDCQPFKSWEQDKVMAWMKHYLKEKQKTISDDALLALDAIGGTQLGILANEIEKVLLYIHNKKDHITYDDIQALHAGKLFTIFDLTKAMQDNHQNRLLEISDSLLENGEDPIKIIGMITATLRLFIGIHTLKAQQLSYKEMATELQKNSYYIQKLCPPVLKNYTLSRLKDAFHYISETDLAIKSGRYKASHALQLIIFHCFA